MLLKSSRAFQYFIVTDERCQEQGNDNSWENAFMLYTFNESKSSLNLVYMYIIYNENVTKVSSIEIYIIIQRVAKSLSENS